MYFVHWFESHCGWKCEGLDGQTKVSGVGQLGEITDGGDGGLA
jgi:hypothetical protein